MLKKQIVAITGLFLVLFIVFHLSVNLLLFLGPNYFNVFPEFMHATGPGLIVAEIGLALLFLTHIIFTILVVKENRCARKHDYSQFKSKGKRSLATRLMPYTGSVLLIYIFTHINDYVLQDHSGSLSVINGASAGIYGVVANSFASPIRVLWYVLAMFSVGFHLAHGIQSVVQTFGYYHPTISPIINKMSTGLGILIGGLFSSIPIYFFLSHVG